MGGESYLKACKCKRNRKESFISTAFRRSGLIPCQLIVKQQVIRSDAQSRVHLLLHYSGDLRGLFETLFLLSLLRVTVPWELCLEPRPAKSARPETAVQAEACLLRQRLDSVSFGPVGLWLWAQEVAPLDAGRVAVGWVALLSSCHKECPRDLLWS